MFGVQGMNEPGTYEIVSGDKTHTVDADSFRYSDTNELEVMKNGQVVAVFRWWDSIRLKAD